jgi:phosphatidate cytidylyltransferase
MKQRTLTALVIMAIVFTFLGIGGLPFTLFIGVVLAVSGYEWCRLFIKGGYHPKTWLVVAGIIGYVFISLQDSEKVYPLFLLGYVFLTILLTIHGYEKEQEKSVVNLLIQLSGVFYLSEFGLSFIRLRNLQNGAWWFFFFIAITALGDTAALFIGKPWGKHKLGNSVSPNKSWEGVIAGVVTAGMTGLIFALYAKDWFLLNPLQGALFGSGVYLVSIIGDLTISMIKRWVGEKNSSELLPGHGGILDRIDSHLWSSTLGYHILVWFVLIAS